MITSHFMRFCVILLRGSVEDGILDVSPSVCPLCHRGEGFYASYGGKRMNIVAYRFDEIHTGALGNHKDYIFQLASRKLTHIYHSHDFYEWLLVLKGSCVTRINGTQYQMEKDQIILMCPGDSHCFLSQDNELTVISLSVKKEEFESFSDAYNVQIKETLGTCEKPILFKVPGMYSNLRLKYGEIFGDCSENACKLLLSYLIKLYLDAAEGDKCELPQKVLEALKEMQKPEHLKEGITALVELSGYSRSQLSRMFQKQFCTTVHEYLKDLRLTMAYNELLWSLESMEAISEKLGYASFSHFNKIFKEKFGITPAALRKRQGMRTI